TLRHRLGEPRRALLPRPRRLPPRPPEAHRARRLRRRPARLPRLRARAPRGPHRAARLPRARRRLRARARIRARQGAHLRGERARAPAGDAPPGSVSAAAAPAAGRLAYGMQLPVQSQSRRYVERWELSAGPEALRRIAAKADATGFFYVAVCDHVVIPTERCASMGAIWYETLATLGHLAALTTRVRPPSHGVVAPYPHPPP